MLTKRIQVLLEEDEYKKLKKMSKKQHKSVGEIVREATELYAGRMADKAERLKIVEKMSSYNLDAPSWDKMEKEIIKARSRF